MKSNLYFLKRKLNENWSFERRPGSGRNKKFDSEIDQKIVYLVRENQFISIKEIKNILKKDLSSTPSYRTIYNILKENSYSYVSLQLVQKINEKNKRVKWCKRNQNRDWRNVIFIDEWTFYLKAPSGKKWIKRD